MATTKRCCTIFHWFESLIDIFKEPADDLPPTAVGRFYLFYLRQVWPVFAALIVTGFGAAIVEVALFDFIGRVELLPASRTPSLGVMMKPEVANGNETDVQSGVEA